MPDEIPGQLSLSPGPPSADALWAAFTDHWAQCGFCQEGLPCAYGDPMWHAAHDALPERDDA